MLRLQLLAAACVITPALGVAQTPPPPATAAAARQIGTVVSATESALVIKPDAAGIGQMTVTLAPGARVLQLAPGSTDLKTAQPANPTDIAAGDRVLVTGAAGDTPETFTARRVVVMKSTDISQQHEASEADWQRRGSGGIVTAIDTSANTIEIASGARKIQIKTSPQTIFRRYSNGSVRFADAVKGTLSDVHVGDQLRVRGARSDDGSSITAEEVVSGSFSHLSGTILTIDAAAHQLSLRDLRTRKLVAVELSDSSSVHTLPPEVAQRLAARANAAGGAHRANAGGSSPATPAAATPAAASDANASGHSNAEGGGRDLNQVVARLPETPLSSLHKGDAVMIVGVPKSSSDTIVAVTLLAGVEPILAANPNGVSDTTLSPWNLGSAPEGGGPQ